MTSAVSLIEVFGQSFFEHFWSTLIRNFGRSAKSDDDDEDEDDERTPAYISSTE